jgi:hypothetical protein
VGPASHGAVVVLLLSFLTLEKREARWLYQNRFVGFGFFSLFDVVTLFAVSLFVGIENDFDIDFESAERGETAARRTNIITSWKMG